MSGFDPQVAAQIAEWRVEAVAGTLTLEEMREGIRILRQDRIAAAASSDSAKRKKAVAAIPSGDDLLNELMRGS